MSRRIREGVFFTFDGIIALMIVVIGIIAFSSGFVSEDTAYPQKIIAEDVVSTLSSLKVADSNNPYIRELILAGGLDDKQIELSVIELIGELWSLDDTTQAQLLVRNITSTINESIAISINSEMLTDPLDTRTIVKSTRLISGINKSSPARGFAANLFLSASGKRVTSHYTYFDGLTGMGDITRYVFLPDNAQVFSIIMELDAADDFSVFLNGGYCGSYTVGTSAEILADEFTISDAECDFSTLIGGLNTLRIEFSGSDPQKKFIAGGFFRFMYTSAEENTYVRSVSDGIVTETIHLNGVQDLANIFGSFLVPGDLVSLSMFVDFQNDASAENEFYIRIADKLVYRQNETGAYSVVLTNDTIGSYFNYSTLSNSTIPLRIGHLESTEISDNASQSDTMVTIESSTTMNACDFPYDGSYASDCDAGNEYLSRLNASQTASLIFMDEYMVIEGNRMGIVGYHATVPPGQVLGLTTDVAAIRNSIINIVGQTPPLCFTCAINRAGTELKTNSNPSRKRAIILMSDGAANRCYYGNPNCFPLGGLSQEEKALNEAIAEACSIYATDKISVFTVGYGLGADNEGLRQISEGCTDGMHFNATDLDELIEVYINLSQLVQGITYEEQIPAIEGNLSSRLFASSHLNISYLPMHEERFGELTLTGQTGGFTQNGTRGTLSLVSPSSIRDARVLSYSAEKWTETVSIGGLTFFNISQYGENYTIIGDPFTIMVPTSLLSTGDNVIDLTLTNATFGSDSNRITFTVYLDANVASYSEVLPVANGCYWYVLQADGEVFEIAIPKSYTGPNVCEYASASYNPNDAYDVSAYRLFSELDIDGDGAIDIFLTEQELTVEGAVIGDIPSLWGPALFEVMIGR